MARCTRTAVKSDANMFEVGGEIVAQWTVSRPKTWRTIVILILHVQFLPTAGGAEIRTELSAKAMEVCRLRKSARTVMAGAEAAPPAVAAGEDEVAVLQAPVHCRLAMEESMEWSMQVSTSTLRATTAACPAEAPSDTEPKCRDEAEEKVEGDPTCRNPPRVIVLA
mmetsp:Transcript_51888/g.148815  ORF Transcript_51888/g.148815 Transcript_51888/m.148815 type:complete len:166 (-) Transcript_51888:746-1243(-)